MNTSLHPSSSGQKYCIRVSSVSDAGYSVIVESEDGRAVAVRARTGYQSMTPSEEIWYEKPEALLSAAENELCDALSNGWDPELLHPWMRINSQAQFRRANLRYDIQQTQP